MNSVDHILVEGSVGSNDAPYRRYNVNEMSEDAATEQMAASDLAELLWDVRAERSNDSALSEDPDVLRPPAPTRLANTLSNGPSEVLTRFPRPGGKTADDEGQLGKRPRWLLLLGTLALVALGAWGIVQMA